MNVSKEKLLRLLNPQSIVVIGGKECERVLQQTQKLGYAGKLWAINPKRETMAGVSCLSSLDELPEIPDAVFVGIPADPTIEVVAQLKSMGVGGAVCLASGFKEVGENGQDRQSRLLDAAEDMPVLGPNCYGFINTLLGVALFPDQHGLTRTEEGVAIISSSGNIGINFTLQQRGLPISWLITIGNQAVIGIEEAVVAALENPKIKAIGLHIEGLKNLPLFIELAARARQRGIPIIVLKTGKSDIGARITMSHTATLAGEAGLYEAMFERLGVGLVDNIEEFLESLKLACVIGPLKGNKLCSMSCSGGEASLIADLSVDRDLEFPSITDDHKVSLRLTLNDYVAIDNPLDYHTFIWGNKQRMTATFAAMMGGGYDLALLIIDFPHVNNCDMTEWIDAAMAFVDACNQSGCKGAVVTCLSETYTEEIRQNLISNGVAPLLGMEQALAAIETMSRIGRAWKEHKPLPEIILIDEQHSAGNIKGMNEFEAKQLLGQMNVTVPDSVLITASCDAVAAAEQLGYPLVMKAVADDIAHKSEIGAVQLNISNGDAVRFHSDRLFALSDRVMLEKQIEESVAELLLGVSYDDLFGKYLILGFGGTLVELIRDRQILFFPLDTQQILAALRSLKTWPLLNGYRGRKIADIEAIIDTIESIGNLIRSSEINLVELEINPLMVKAKGQGAVAADALIRQNTL